MTCAFCNAHTREDSKNLFDPTESASFHTTSDPGTADTYKETLNSISVSYGVLSGVQAVYSFARVLGVVFSIGVWNCDNLKYSGGFSADYMRSVSRLIDFGFVASTENIRGNYRTMNLDTQKYEYSGTFNETFSCFMPQTRLNYMKSPHFALYGKTAFGICWHHSEQRDKAGVNTTDYPESLTVCAHLTPIVWEEGGRNLRGLMELVIGWLVTVSFGARVRF